MSRPTSVSTKQRRIAELAREDPKRALTSLNHHMDIEWLREAFRRTRKDGAAGVDGQTARDYEAKLEDNLGQLLERAKSGLYRAPAVRRVYIPKGSGKERRPLGIPTFEDRVLQRAVQMLLEPLYEQDFLDVSYGFRPQRSAHQALETIRSKLMRMGGGWILDVDVRKFFDSMSHQHLREILRKRVRDGVVLRLIGKWLKAGVLEEGRVVHPDSGTPQGGVISPLLANVYLHEVLDCWFREAVRPRLRGQGFLVRYADDVVMGFELEEDAGRVLDVLPKRLARYALSLHPEKTRLVPFRRPPDKQRRPPGSSGGPGSFDFLGFTHYWGRSRRGWWVIKKKTAKDRLARSVCAVSEWCRAHRHLPLEEQHRGLVRKLRGHNAYYGVRGNSRMLNRFQYLALRAWHKWLNRRSQRRSLTWARFLRQLKRFPLPRLTFRAPPCAVNP